MSAPGSGRMPAERRVDVPPTGNPLQELMSRPVRNTSEVTGVVPDIGQTRPAIPLDAVPGTES